MQISFLSARIVGKRVEVCGKHHSDQVKNYARNNIDVYVHYQIFQIIQRYGKAVAARGVPRLDGHGARNKFGGPMFKTKVFWDLGVNVL